MEIKRKLRKLKLGEYYVVWFDYKNKIMCKFIQPTKCGFNFLNLNTNKCVLPHHLYPNKHENHLSGNWFWVNEYMKIEQCK